MKRILLILLILNSCLGLTAQTGVSVKGVVLDAKNKTPLPYVALFFERSAHGDITNSGGEFTINTNEHTVKQQKLKVMFTGYHTQEIALNADSDEPLKIYLMPLAQKDDIPILEVMRIMGESGQKPLAYYIYHISNIVRNDNFPLGNPETNKVDLYRIREIPAYNHLEGVRLRLSAATNARLHSQLFAKGYLGYGFKDRKLKYRGELAWAFKPKAYHDKEFPRNNIRLIHEKDVFSPGENNPRLLNDFLLLSYRRSRGAMMYREFTELNYEKETLYGFSYELWARQSEIKSASDFSFVAANKAEHPHALSSLKSKKAGIALRYWPNEAYIQEKRQRIPFTMTEPLFYLSHTMGRNTVFGEDQTYHKTEFSLQRRFSLGFYGHLDFVADYQKVWTKSPYPLLLYPNANRGFFVDNKSFFLVRAMDFINDEQYSIRLAYMADNLLLARIPILDKLGFRELFILRGVHGKLSSKNKPNAENGLFMLPPNTIEMNNTPYMEGVVGITNILGVLRVEYVHRLTYRNQPGVLKYGIRLDASF